VPNGLSQLHGTLEFNQNRLEVRSLTAMSGGGLLSVAGYLAYQHGIYADLSATGKGIRIRYPQGVSSLADATMHLQGPQNNLLLAGDVLITRFTSVPTWTLPPGRAGQRRADHRAPTRPPTTFASMCMWSPRRS
jgi:translocation and assembly module TamB